MATTTAKELSRGVRLQNRLPKTSVSSSRPAASSIELPRLVFPAPIWSSLNSREQ